MQSGHHHRGEDLLAALEHNAADPSALDQRAGYPGVGADLGAEAARRALDGVGHRTHPPFGEAPVAQVTVADVTDRVVGHDVGGAGLGRAGPGPDHPVDGDRSFHLPRLEPVVQEVGDAHRHQPGHVCDRPHIEAALTPGQAQGLQQVGRLTGSDLRGHREQQRPEHVGQACDPRVPLGHRFGVLLRPLGDLLVVPLGVVGEDLDRPALGERLVVRPHRGDLVTVPLEVEVPHDGRREQAHHIRKPGDAELRRIGPRRLGGRGAPGLVATLENHRPGSGSGEVRAERRVRCAHHPPQWRRTSRSLDPLLDLEGRARGACLTDCSV